MNVDAVSRMLMLGARRGRYNGDPAWLAAVRLWPDARREGADRAVVVLCAGDGEQWWANPLVGGTELDVLDWLLFLADVRCM